MSNTRQFEGKVIIVTGAGTGMGADTAILLAERGAKVTIAGRREAPLREIEAKIIAAGGEALVVSADVSKPDDATRMVAETVKRFGTLHGAVNNAGIASENYDLPELPYELWDQTIGINLSSIFYCMRAQLPAIEKAGGGAIVNVSSVFADRGLPMRAAYSASKHGIRGITRSSALDWAARGIRINELQPGVIDTPMLSHGGEQENAQIVAHIAAKRMGLGREIATAVAFLLSEEASYVVGAHLAVDGGFLA
jgi:NAD(P)-dependent dehydrogenase (short-subunit alcohol dehydrogenase family)